MKIRRHPEAALADLKTHVSMLARAAVLKESPYRTRLATVHAGDELRTRYYRHKLSNAERRSRAFYAIAAALPSGATVCDLANAIAKRKYNAARNERT